MAPPAGIPTNLVCDARCQILALGYKDDPKISNIP